MKEQEIIDLGFERTDVTAEESGHDQGWYYYSLTLIPNVLQLISCDNNLAKKDCWCIEILGDEEEVEFTKSKDVKQLIDLINKVKRK